MHRLHQALDAYNAAPLAERPAIEQEIWHRLGSEHAVLVLDMSGFSRIVKRLGIVFYLAMIRRMERVTRPIVAAHRGAVVKYEADNLFAVFPSPADAVAAALAINAGFRSEPLPDAAPDGATVARVRVSIGIDWGRIVLVPEHDMFGDAVNTASKLGEDLAAAGQILVTERAASMLPDAQRGSLHPVQFAVSGVAIDALAIDTEAPGDGIEIYEHTPLD